MTDKLEGVDKPLSSLPIACCSAEDTLLGEEELWRQEEEQEEEEDRRVGMVVQLGKEREERAPTPSLPPSPIPAIHFLSNETALELGPGAPTHKNKTRVLTYGSSR